MACDNCKCDTTPIDPIKTEIEKLKDTNRFLARELDAAQGRINNINQFLDALMSKYIGHKYPDMYTDTVQHFDYFLADRWSKGQGVRLQSIAAEESAIATLQSKGYTVTK